jgi:AIPR protein
VIFGIVGESKVTSENNLRVWAASTPISARAQERQRGLRQTILEDPSHFLAYNNGIVAIADDIEIGLTPEGPAIKALPGLQIVNGGQTTASLHRARKHDKASLDGIMVPAKIIRDKSDNLDAIVRASSLHLCICL